MADPSSHYEIKLGVSRDEHQAVARNYTAVDGAEPDRSGLRAYTIISADCQSKIVVHGDAGLRDHILNFLNRDFMSVEADRCTTEHRLEKEEDINCEPRFGEGDWVKACYGSCTGHIFCIAAVRYEVEMKTFEYLYNDLVGGWIDERQLVLLRRSWL